MRDPGNEAGNSYLVLLMCLYFDICKHVMTGSNGNREFCFPETLAEGNIAGKQTLCFPWGQS